MRYASVCKGRFVSRPNRFTAEIEINGEIVLCHVKNTGRLKELLIPGAEVSLCPADKSARKTPYDVIAVRKDGQWVNIDSQIINRVFEEWAIRDYPRIRREVVCGSSRFDFLADEDFYVEVKGVTLRDGDRALFPDAPTLRGEKHLRELANLVREGKKAAVAFVCAIPGCSSVSPHPERESFLQALENAKQAGVILMGFACDVSEDSIVISHTIPVK